MGKAEVPKLPRGLYSEVLDEGSERSVGIKSGVSQARCWFISILGFCSQLLCYFLAFLKARMRPGFIQPWHQMGLGCIQPWLRMRPGFIQPRLCSVAVLGPRGREPLPEGGRGMGRADGKDLKNPLIFHLSALFVFVTVVSPPAFPGCCRSRASAGDEWELQTCQEPSRRHYLGTGYLGTCLAMPCEHQHCAAPAVSPQNLSMQGPPSAPWTLRLL